MGAGHVQVGIGSALTWGQLRGWTVGETVVAACLATVTSAGLASPDMDQAFPWHWGPLKHRGITHWWGTAATLTALVHVYASPVMAQLAGGLLIGWWSHLLADLFFGRAFGNVRGPGIPVMPWWGHVGFGLDVDGRTEHLMTRLILPGVLVVLGHALITGATP